MARTFASGKYLETSTAPNIGPNVTLSAWFRSTSSTAYQTILSIADSSTYEEWRLALEGNIAGDKLSFYQQGFATSSNALTSVGYSVNTWTHILGTSDNAGHLAVYKNNGSVGTAGTSNPSVTENTISIGRIAASGHGGLFEGEIAEVGIWAFEMEDAALRQALANGVSPLKVAPESLVFYAPVIGRYSPEIDLRGGYNLTVTGAPAAARHPRVFYNPF